MNMIKKRIMIFRTSGKEICTKEVQLKVYIDFESKFRSFPIDWEAQWPNCVEQLETKNLLDHAPEMIQGHPWPQFDIEFQGELVWLFFIIFSHFFDLLACLDVPFL